MPDPQRELAEFLEQLERLPGGPAAALPDFFGPWLAPASAERLPEQALDSLALKDGDSLLLTRDGRLIHLADGRQTLIATLDAAALAAVGDLATTAMPPLPLALVAIALGAVDDGRRLKKALPKLDGAARDLMLMTVCRLCG